MCGGCWSEGARQAKGLPCQRSSGSASYPSVAPTAAPKMIPTGPAKVPTAAPSIPHVTAADFFDSILRVREGGALRLPCQPRAVREDTVDFSRLQAMQAGKRMFS